MEFDLDLGIFLEFGLILGIRFEQVLGGLSRLKAMPLSALVCPSMSKDMSNNSINQREAQNCSIVGSNKKIIYSNSIKTNRKELIRRSLSGITNDELQNLVRVREEVRRPIPTSRRRIPVPAPRKMGVKQLIRFFENNPIPPYRPIPAPRTKTQQPVPAPRTRIGEKQRALKGFTKSYEIGLKSDRDALVHLKNTRLALSRLFGTILNEIKGFKCVETLKVTFVKKKDDDDIDTTAYFNSRAQIEAQNSINVNVFGYEDKQFYPIYMSKQNNNEVLNLLLITEGEKKHYVLIKDFNRMMYNKTKHQHRKHFCMRYL